MLFQTNNQAFYIPVYLFVTNPFTCICKVFKLLHGMFIVMLRKQAVLYAFCKSTVAAYSTGDKIILYVAGRKRKKAMPVYSCYNIDAGLQHWSPVLTPHPSFAKTYAFCVLFRKPLFKVHISLAVFWNSSLGMSRQIIVSPKDLRCKQLC